MFLSNNFLLVYFSRLWLDCSEEVIRLVFVKQWNINHYISIFMFVKLELVLIYRCIISRKKFPRFLSEWFLSEHIILSVTGYLQTKMLQKLGKELLAVTPNLCAVIVAVIVVVVLCLLLPVVIFEHETFKPLKTHKIPFITLFSGYLLCFF